MHETTHETVRDDVKDPEKKTTRTVVLKSTVELIVSHPDGTKETKEPYRNILSIFNAVKELPDDVKLEAYVNEDPQQSDPLEEGKERFRKLFVGEGPASKKEFLQALLNSLVDENMAMLNFQNLCDFLCVHSTLKCAVISLVFEGKKEPVAGGFSFLSGSGEVKKEDLIVLGEAALAQTKMFKDKVHTIYPDAEFPSDSKIIIPGA